METTATFTLVVHFPFGEMRRRHGGGRASSQFHTIADSRERYVLSGVCTNTHAVNVHDNVEMKCTYGKHTSSNETELSIRSLTTGLRGIVCLPARQAVMSSTLEMVLQVLSPIFHLGPF